MTSLHKKKKSHIYDFIKNLKAALKLFFSNLMTFLGKWFPLDLWPKFKLIILNELTCQKMVRMKLWKRWFFKCGWHKVVGLDDKLDYILIPFFGWVWLTGWLVEWMDGWKEQKLERTKTRSIRLTIRKRARAMHKWTANQLYAVQLN